MGSASSFSPIDTPLLVDLEHSAVRQDVALSGSMLQMTWRRWGDGPPVVLLHGGHGNWRHWARNVEVLATRHTVLVPDLPGYGDSSPPADHTLESMVTVVRRSLDELLGPNTPIGVVGFSFGGLVAAGLSAESSAVSCLALLGPAGHGGERRPKGELRNWRPAFEREDWVEFEATMRHNLMMHMLHDVNSLDTTALAIHAKACLQTRFHSKLISRSSQLPQLLERYPGPVVLAWGEHDVTAHPHHTASMLMQRSGASSSVVVPRSGHWVQYEAAIDVNSLLLTWLDQNLSPCQEI